MDSAMELLSKKRGFSIADKAAHRPHNPLVVGSNPTGPTLTLHCVAKLRFSSYFAD